MRPTIFTLTLISILFLGISPAPADGLPDASWDKLPRWRGFNLLEKFQVYSQKPFAEKDFQMIQEMGFNFVRLPMDYRCWIVDGDWENINENVLKEIDQAVAWGEKYGIHVNLNFHRAPGFTVADPQEKTSLWTDKKTQEVCASHWAMFAKRYKGIPNSRLSFNLFNEPFGVDEDTHYAVVKIMADAIRAEDPDRLIICDGLEWGSKPFRAAGLKVAAATRGYAPMEISHYRASWVDSGGYPVPTWPIVSANGMIFGSWKQSERPGRRLHIRLEGPFPKETMLRFRVHQVSTKADFYVSADEKPIFEKLFEPKDGEGEWKTVVHAWGCYQNIYDRDYEAVIPAGTETVTIGIREGDWMNLSRLEIAPTGGEPISLNLQGEWDRDCATLVYDAGKHALRGDVAKDREFLKKTVVAPWQESAGKDGVGVMVGEFGAFRYTPHDVTLRWMEDCLANWREAGWGWALWNFRGSFGILDSDREDVEYEDFHGHKLDREMLELLKRY